MKTIEEKLDKKWGNMKFIYKKEGLGWPDFKSFCNNVMAAGYDGTQQIRKIDLKKPFGPKNFRLVGVDDKANKVKNESVKVFEFCGYKYSLKELSEVTGINLETIDKAYAESKLQELLNSHE